MANIKRINGIKTNLEALSDTEIENGMQYAHERIERAVLDLEHLGEESGRRLAMYEPVAEVAMAQIIQFPKREYQNGTLWD